MTDSPDDFLTHTAFKRGEFEARQRAHYANIERIGKFLPKESVQKYLDESDARLEVETRDEVLFPEFSAEELAEIKKLPKVAQKMWAKLSALAGKTGAELGPMREKSKAKYAKDVSRVRWILAQFWLHVLLASHEEHKRKGTSVVCLRDNLLPEETEEDIRRDGGSHLGYMRRDLGSAGIVYAEQQNACYAEFVGHIKAYCAAHSEGLTLSSYDKVCLVKNGKQFVVR